MKQELAPRGVGIPVLQGREDVNSRDGKRYGKWSLEKGAQE